MRENGRAAAESCLFASTGRDGPPSADVCQETEPVSTWVRQLTAWIGLALITSGVSAQEFNLPMSEESLPELSMPSLSGGGETPTSPAALGPVGDATYMQHDEDAFGNFATEDWHQHVPAPIESTGTWLRRGFWYAEADAVVWNRNWNRDNKWFAADDPDVESPTFFFQTAALLSTNRLLVLDGAHPGEDTSVRVTLGHFLFRDQRNRDHTAEFTVFGGGDWEQHREISSLADFGLFVPFVIDGANRSFDGSSSQTMDYSSHYSSFEANYRVKQRMERDQLVMDPNGCWHRAANPGFTRDYLVGLRFMQMRDIMDWRAEDILQTGSDGIYQIRTDNDMFGFQMGTGFAYEASRWSLGLNTKGGVFLNDAKGRSFLDFTDEDDDEDDFHLRLTEDELSFVGEAKLIGKWHLTPNFSLRASYEMMYVSAVALAPNQATFIPVFATLNTTQDPFYHGASFGFEGYW
jgi:hypothetical protein